MPMVRMTPAMPGQRQRGVEESQAGEQQEQVEDQPITGVDAREPVIEEQEPSTKTRPAERRADARRIESAPSVGPTVRSSR